MSSATRKTGESESAEGGRGLGEIFKHSAIYAVGQALQSMVSFLLLPLYTSYLARGDYGVIGILDVSMALVAIFVGRSFYVAATRFQFDPAHDHDSHAVWTTALTCVVISSAVGIVPLLLTSELLGDLLLGGEVVERGRFITLALVTLFARILVETCLGYVRAQKRSILFSIYTLTSLVVAVGLNVWFIAFLGWGIEGFLWSGLITAYLSLAALAGILLLGKPYRVVSSLVPKLLKFVWPLAVTDLCTLMMHQSSVFLLRALLNDLDRVGLFVLAYRLVQGAYQLVILPFESIWSVEVYSLDRSPNRLSLFRSLFRIYVVGMAVLFASLGAFCRLLIDVMAAPEYFPAAELVPPLALAFFFLSLHPFFRTPALIHKRTTSIARTAATAALVCGVANVALISMFGVVGAPWALVLTYMTFSFVGHLRYRTIEALGFPLRWVALASLVGGALCVTTYATFVWVNSMVVEATALAIYAAVFLVVGGLIARRILRRVRVSTEPTSSERAEPATLAAHRD